MKVKKKSIYTSVTAGNHRLGQERNKSEQRAQVYAQLSPPGP